MKYVIIGNGTAAIAAAESIRARDGRGEIVMIADEPYHTYGRPLISYYLLGKTDAERMKYRADDFYSENGIETLFGKRAVKLDPEKKEIVLADGERIGYDRLLLATGSRPFDPPMEGIERVSHRFHFMTFADALALEKELSPEKRVLIVGAGLIGLKCLEGIADRVASVSVIDMADRILPSVLDAYGAGIVQRELEKRATFYLKDSVAKFEKDRAYLKSGKQVAFDVLVVAVGVRPNVELLKEAGGAVSRGILTDDGQRTTLQDVYAAGDCTESYDVTAGSNKILALLPNAQFQGACAGTNMAGGDAHFTNAVPMNAIGFFGSHILTAGSYVGETYEEKSERTYKKLFYADGKLKGFILVNMPERAGIYTSLLRNAVPLTEVDFEALKREPGLMAFSASYRAEKLAGAAASGAREE